MSELKILIHIGHHLNVVNLLGACTKAGGEESSVNQEQNQNTFQTLLDVWKCLWCSQCKYSISSSLLTGELLQLLQDVASSHPGLLNLSHLWCHLAVLSGGTEGRRTLDCSEVPSSSPWAFPGFFSLSFPALSGGCLSRLSWAP